MVEQFANNANSTLASDIDATTTTIPVVDGSSFPSTGDFRLAIEDELLLCTSRTGNDLTCTRGIEGTTNASHSTGENVCLVLSAASLQEAVLKYETGEANTASNQGAGGVGPFIQKTVVDLELKNIAPGSSKVTITDDVANNEIDVDIDETNIDHDNLSNFVTNEHIDHSSVTITGTDSVTGGGDLTTSQTLNLVNDEASPGNAEYYGTDTGGTKGYHQNLTTIENVSPDTLGNIDLVEGTNVIITPGTNQITIDADGPAVLAHAARLLQTSIQAIASGSPVKILFDAIDYDNVGTIASVSTSDLTIARGGKYVVNGNFYSAADANNNDEQVLCIVKNGSPAICTKFNTGQNNEDVGVQVTGILDLMAGDVLSLTVQVDTATSSRNDSGRICALACVEQVGASGFVDGVNVGAGGVGVYKDKTGFNLNFKNINAGEGISITDDTLNDEVDVAMDISTILTPATPNGNIAKFAFDEGGLFWVYGKDLFSMIDDLSEATDPEGVDEIAIYNDDGGDARKVTLTNLSTTIDHDTTANFVTNEHIDHSSVTITGTNSVTGGGDITASRTLNLVNDAASPGNSKYYGTDSGGTKGFHTLTGAFSRGHLFGLNITDHNGSQLTVKAGQCRDDAGTFDLILPSDLTKTFASPWVQGNNQPGQSGATQPGAFHAIYVIGDSSGTNPVGVSFGAIPSGYDKFRRVGFYKRDAATGNPIFYQDADWFWWENSFTDFNGNPPNTNFQATTINVPGLSSTPIQAIMCVARTTVNQRVHFRSPLSTTTAGLHTFESGGNNDRAFCMVPTNARTINWRASSASGNLTLFTNGWIDVRGRNQ